MDLFEAMEHRHAVRSYEDRPIAPEAREALLACIAQCNRESGLHIQLVLDEPRGFGGLPAAGGHRRGAGLRPPGVVVPGLEHPQHRLLQVPGGGDHGGLDRLPPYRTGIAEAGRTGISGCGNR